jgi:transcriptional regulator with XRE-family HTH domain
MRMFASEVAERFSADVLHFRREADLSQEALGMRATLHRTEIGLLERRTRMPQLDTVLKIAGALDVSPCELLDGMRWTPGSYSPGGFAVDERSDSEAEEAPR